MRTWVRLRRSYASEAETEKSARSDAGTAGAEKIAGPDAGEAENGKAVQFGVKQIRNSVAVTVGAGNYIFEYEPTKPYRKIYSIDSPIEELMENEETREIVEKEYLSRFDGIPFEKELYTLEELMNGPFTSLPHDEQETLDRKLRRVES